MALLLVLLPGRHRVGPELVIRLLLTLIGVLFATVTPCRNPVER
ncbi:hypothetical protein [Streptomyces sp. NPDC012510]